MVPKLCAREYTPFWKGDSDLCPQQDRWTVPRNRGPADFWRHCYITCCSGQRKLFPLNRLGRDVSWTSFKAEKWLRISCWGEWGNAHTRWGSGEGNGERQWRGAYGITLKFHLVCMKSAEELKKYLNVLQRKKAWNSRNSLSLATTISKGNPGTASLWRRILEIVSEPRSNKEQKWVFVTCASSLLSSTLQLSGNHCSLQPIVFLNHF